MHHFGAGNVGRIDSNLLAKVLKVRVIHDVRVQQCHLVILERELTNLGIDLNTDSLGRYPKHPLLVRLALARDAVRPIAQLLILGIRDESTVARGMLDTLPVPALLVLGIEGLGSGACTGGHPDDSLHGIIALSRLLLHVLHDLMPLILDNIKDFRLSNLNRRWWLGRICRIGKIVVDLIAEAMIDHEIHLGRKQDGNRSEIKLLVRVILEHVQEMSVDEVRDVDILRPRGVDPVLESGKSLVIKHLADLLHRCLDFDIVHRLQTAGPLLSWPALVQCKLHEALNTDGKTDGIQDQGTGRRLLVVLAHIHIKSALQDLDDARRKNVGRLGNLIEEGSHRRGQKRLELVLLNHRNLCNDLSVIGPTPHTRLEHGGIDNQLEGLGLESSQTSGVTVRKKVKDERNSNVRRGHELKEPLCIRRRQNVAECRQLLRGQMQNIILIVDLHGLAPIEIAK